MSKNNIAAESIRSLLKHLGVIGAGVFDIEVEQIHPDGSQRRFFRVHLGGTDTLVAVLPPIQNANGMAEAQSFWEIGSHLEGSGTAVPAMIGFDQHSGLVLCEDLGTVRLHDVVTGNAGMKNKQLESLYRSVIEELVRMQVHGYKDFDPSWCWDSPRYDRALMLERESGYFLQSFCRDYLQLDVDSVDIGKEFSDLAGQASEAPADFFLHRDFQSRNIMIKDSKVRIVDFQGGRLGPLGYDLASLLRDPYVSLTQDLQENLLSFYISTIQGILEYDEKRFRQEYFVLALQRNLQALGAFGYLTGVLGKTFFRSAIFPALSSLQSLLAKPEMAGYPVLRKLTDRCLEKIA